MPIGIGAGTAIAGIVGGGAAITAGAINAHAAGNAADDQLKANEDALQAQQANQAYANQVAETNRRANYDQWAAREGQLSSVGQMLGLPARQIPDYVPLPPGASTAVPGSSYQPPPVVSPGATPSVTAPPGYVLPGVTTPSAPSTVASALKATGATGIPNPVNPGFDTAGYPLPKTATPALPQSFQAAMTGYAPGTIGAYLAGGTPNA
jgi:hypothetical protein